MRIHYAFSEMVSIFLGYEIFHTKFDMLKIACLSWLIEHQIGPLNKLYGLSSLKSVMHLMSLDSPMFVLVALRNLHVSYTLQTGHFMLCNLSFPPLKYYLNIL